MFEAQVAYYLNHYLGQYVEDINGRSLAISIYEGNVVLKNLRLKPEALAELNLPVTVKAGLLGSLTLKVPWSSLGRVPVDVRIDQLYILAGPRLETDDEGLDGLTALAQAFQEAKLKRVARQESQWIHELQSLEQKKAAKQGKGGEGDGDKGHGGGGGGGFLRGLIDTIVGNLQLSISNVHVRYEDDITHPGHPFACGFTMEKMSGATVDEMGRPAFVTTSPLDVLRKSLLLRRVALYFDCDEGGWDPAQAWGSAAPEVWERWFQPGLALAPLSEEGGLVDPGNAAARQYVLLPVDGRATYVRRGRNVPRSEKDPASEVDFTLDAVAVAATQAQYRSYSLLLSEISTFTARLPQSGYRPSGRPAPGAPARLWWRYAGLAIKQQMEARRLTWRQVLRFAELRRRYVPLYAQHLRGDAPAGSPAPAAGGGGIEPQEKEKAKESKAAAPGSATVPAEIAEMDEVLPEPTILMFRRLAHAEVQRERRREAAAAAAAGKPAKQQKAQSVGWMGWIMGSRGGKKEEEEEEEEEGGGVEHQFAPAAAEELGQERPELSSEEYSKLIELVMQQEEGVQLGIETPHSLLTQVKIRVGSASAQLLGPDGSLVLRGSLEGITAAADMFPVTHRVELGVTAMGVESPEGVFLQTGAAPGMHSLDASLMDRAGSMVRELQAVTSDRALAVSFIQRPQDDSADVVVDAVLTPSYVYYSAAAVERVVQFFSPPQELQNLDFSNLSAAASSQLERARKAAAEYAAAALSNKPRLKMRLDLEAPKVAIPVTDSQGAVSLALDLGRFIIETDHATASSLPPEEAGLYECIRLSGSNVSAYAVDGAFDWAQLEEGGASSADLKLVRLLDRCGMEVGLQAARYPEPRYPRLRLSPSVPILHFHFSPGRISRMLRVINAALPSSAPVASQPSQALEDAVAKPGQPVDEAWRRRAEHEGAVRMLLWTGLGRATAGWHRRHAVLYQGSLYVYENERSGNLAATVGVWPDKEVVRVPAENVAGCPHVLAVRPAAPAGVEHSFAGISEDPSATLLRCDSEETAEDWYRSLLRAQQAMQELAGAVVGAEGEADWDGASSTVSAGDLERASAAGTSEPAEPETPQGAAAGGSSVLLQIDAQLGEFALFVSGREPTDYWPPPQPGDETTVETSGAGVGGSTGDLCTPILRKGNDAGEVDGEVPLIVLRASGGSMGFTYGDFGMTIHTGLHSLDILDTLVGRKCPAYCFLACSSKPNGRVVEVDDDLFFDPVTSRSDSDLTRTGSGEPNLSPAGSWTTPGGGRRGRGEDAEHAKQDLAEFTFKLRRPNTDQYEGVDTALDIKLNQLYVFCNRPTVAALITMGLDVSVAALSVFVIDETAAVAAPDSQVDPAGAGAGGGAGEDEEDVEVVESAQLLGPAAGRRALFSMSLALRTLQVVLNYEGHAEEALAEACITDFDFDLSLAPDGEMRITSSLGNLSATDRTLPEDHPYHQACGLRLGSDTSLVHLTFTSHPASHSTDDPRVPTGYDFYTLQARLSELQLVFLYRFLQENLLYLSMMLAMRPPPLQPQPAQQQREEQTPAASAAIPPPPQLTPKEGEEPAGNAAVAPLAAAAEVRPFILAMDLEMNAPVIALPHSSDSRDAIVLDLGVLRLTSAVESHGTSAASLVEVAEVTFSGVECTVVQAGRRGHSVVRNPEQGWQLQWRRPLIPTDRSDAPFFDLAINVPTFKASLSDAEYMLMTSVAAANFTEPMALPEGADWVTQQHRIDQLSALESSTADLTATPPASPQELLHMLTPVTGGDDEDEGPPSAAAGATPAPAATPAAAPLCPAMAALTSIRTVVSLGAVELELRQSVEGLPDPVPLARFAVAELYVAFRNTEGGTMHVDVNIPKVEAKDLRPDVPPEQSMAISSGHKASFLMLKWESSAEMQHQALQITLQKPLIVAELGFLVDVTRFVMPTFSFVKSSPVPHATYDVILQEGCHVASETLWLSPAVRLLADAPGVTSCEYDGKGHSIVLPSRDHLDELLPLIIIGSSCTLRLKNVTVVNASSLSACLQLAPGARLVCHSSDGVALMGTKDGRVSSPRDPPGGLRSPTAGARRLSFEAPSLPRKSEVAGGTPAPPEQPSAAEPAPRGSIEITLNAVGVGLQLMQLEKVRGLSNPPSRAGSSAATLTRAGSHAQGSAADLTLAAEERGGGGVHRTPSATRPLTALDEHRSIRLLMATMDLAAHYKSEGLAQKGRVEIQGLRAETRTIADLGRVMQDRAAEELAQHRKVRGKKETVVLQPCRVVLDFDLQSEQPLGLVAPQLRLTNVDLRLSDIRLTLSPAVADLVGSLGTGALSPLMQPGPDAPLRAVRQYERVWSIDPSSAWQEEDQLAVSLSVMGGGAGVTVWRPITPTGYGIVGHVITAGDASPSFEVLAVAVNSGLVAYPLSFQKMWAGGGATIWRPVPPQGYVAVGDLAALGHEEPEVFEVLCLHNTAVVESPVGECLVLPQLLPQTPSASVRLEAELPPVDFWCVDNTMGTFWTVTADGMAQVEGRDLRTPAGLTPSALLAMGAAVSTADVKKVDSQGVVTGSMVQQPIISKLQLVSSPRALFDTFNASRQQKRTEEVRRTLTPAVVDFRRIWSDQGFYTDGEGLTLWRPVVPQGYVSLGDCAVRGFHPPPSCLVMREDYAGEGKGMPLVKLPLDFQPIWSDSNPRPELRLNFWWPIAPEGYVAMGCVASVGPNVPSKNVVKCVRRDAAVAAGPPRTPLWAVERGAVGMAPVRVWPSDEALGTFLVDIPDRKSTQQQRWKLGLAGVETSVQLARGSQQAQQAAEAQQAASSAQRQGVDVILNTGSISLLLLDALHTPVVEVETTGVEAGVHGPSRQVMQAYLGLQPSISAYNRALRHWEPMLEPVDVIFKCDSNTGNTLASGIEPGIHMTVKSSAEMVYTTLALTHALSFLSAMEQWRAVKKDGALRLMQISSIMDSDASAVMTTVTNALGTEAAMELDFGDRMGLVKLPAGESAAVLRPIQQFLRRKNADLLPREAMPHELLLVDVQAASGAALTPGRRICCTVRLQGAGVDGAPPPQQYMRTRGVAAAATASKSEDPAEAAWEERLVLPLPSRPSPSHLLAFEVWDVDVKGGKGAILGAGSVEVAVEQLSERETQDIAVAMTVAGGRGAVQCTLRASYMLQRQWKEHVLSEAAGGKEAWDAAEPTRGTRALSLPQTKPGAWSVIPNFGQSRTLAAAALASNQSLRPTGLTSVIPLNVNGEALVLEGCLMKGEWRELLRALCQVVNSSELTLEVCMVATGKAGEVLRLALGRVAPGDALPLPLGWNLSGRHLAFRPVLTEAEAGENFDGTSPEAVHEWSVDAHSASAAALPLDNLDEAITRLVSCAPLALASSDLIEPERSLNTQGVAATPPPAASSTVWFSLMVECDLLTTGKRGEPLTDWRIMVGPPLTITNQLPLPATLIVWEHVPEAKGTAMARLSQRVPSGEQAAVYTADMRRPVSFTLFPDGYDWAGAGPAVLSTGLARMARPLPDRFSLVRPGSRLPVEVFLQRDYQLGPWLLREASSEELDPGTAVARGVPLAVTLLAPLWVVNATGLAIEAAVVQVATPLQPKKDAIAGRNAAAAAAAAAAASPVAAILRTSNVQIPGMPPMHDPPGARTVAPTSMELLSYPLPNFLGGASTVGSADAKQAARRQHYGVRLKIANSGWTSPLVVNTMDLGGNGSDRSAVENLQNAKPVLIQAEAREFGIVYEVTARLEVTPFNNSQVLRLEPYIVVTNRTAVPLQLLQCRPQARSPLAPEAFCKQLGAVPEGGESFVAGATREANALPVAGPGPPLMRPQLRSVSSRTIQTEESVIWSSEPSPGAQQQQWRPTPSVLPAAPLVRLPSGAQKEHERMGATLQLPAGAAAIPLNLCCGLKYARHVLCFRCDSGGPKSSSSEGEGEEEVPVLWSRPLTIHPDREEQHCVAIPACHGGVTTGAGGVALLRLSVRSRGPGMHHVVLESVNTEAPFLLENRTPFPLQYRQAHIPNAPFHTLPPLSAAGYVWEYTMDGSSGELELQEGMAVGSSEIYALSAAEGRAKPLHLSATPHQATVRVGFLEMVAMNPAGVTAIAGDETTNAPLGRGGVDRALQVAPGRDPLLMAGLKGVAATHPDIRATVEIPGLELSIVDDSPQEILLLTVTGVKVVAAGGLTPVGPFRSLRCDFQRVQGDNQLFECRYPVFFSARKSPIEGQQQSARRQALPMLCLTGVRQIAGSRGRSFFPFIGLRFPQGVQVAISEPVVWKLLDIAQRLSQAASSSGDGDGVAGDGMAAADLPVRVRHLNFGDIALNVSFQGDPLSRPRHLAGGMVAMLIDLANFQAAPIVLHGFDRVELRSSTSAFAGFLTQWFQGELFGIGLSLVRNFGVIGGASRVLGILSAGVAKLSGDSRSERKEPPMPSAASSSRLTKTPSQRSISDVGDGLLEGAGAFGSSIMRGIRGLVEKPLQGAKQAGVEGAMKGIAKGIVGVVANPVSGALDALSATAEGFDAAFSAKSRGEQLVTQRRRLPRVVGGDSKLTPLLRDGSEREAIIEQLGNALLWATLLAAQTVPGGGARRAQGTEAYEEHFVLPNKAVAILTNRSMLLASAPGFAQLNGAAEIGSLVSADVAPGGIIWSVRWDDVLALELRWSGAGSAATSGRYPDCLVVHRRGTPGVVGPQPLARLLPCFPDTPQASQVKLVAEKVLRKYYQDPVRQDAQWTERHAARAALPTGQSLDQLPLTLPSLDFKPVWHTNPARQPVVYFWRPVAPPGYSPAGDVATLGDEAPLNPVPCFRDDATLRPSAKPAASAPTSPPLEYTLIWRFNGERAVSMWMPVAPRGYVALGAVVVGGPSVPRVNEYVTIRADMTAPGRVFDSPIWAYDPAPASVTPAAAGAGSSMQDALVAASQQSQPELWKIAVWPVDNRVGTFLAVRALSKPPAELARTVVAVEKRESAREEAFGPL